MQIGIEFDESAIARVRQGIRDPREDMARRIVRDVAQGFTTLYSITRQQYPVVLEYTERSVELAMSLSTIADIIRGYGEEDWRIDYNLGFMAAGEGFSEFFRNSRTGGHLLCEITADLRLYETPRGRLREPNARQINRSYVDVTPSRRIEVSSRAIYNYGVQASERMDNNGAMIPAGVMLPASDYGSIEARGTMGPPGMTGADGIPGAPGDSAYTIAVRNGFRGSEAEFVNTIIGSRTVSDEERTLATIALTSGAAPSTAVSSGNVTIRATPPGQLPKLPTSRRLLMRKKP